MTTSCPLKGYKTTSFLLILPVYDNVGLEQYQIKSFYYFSLVSVIRYAV